MIIRSRSLHKKIWALKYHIAKQFALAPSVDHTRRYSLWSQHWNPEFYPVSHFNPTPQAYFNLLAAKSFIIEKQNIVCHINKQNVRVIRDCKHFQQVSQWALRKLKKETKQAVAIPVVSPEETQDVKKIGYWPR